MFNYRPNYLLTGLISGVVIATGLIAVQSPIRKALAQTTLTSLNGAGSSLAAPLYAGLSSTTVTGLAPKGSWFNTYGVGNPSSLNPPGPLNRFVTFRYAATGSGRGITAFLTQTPPPGTPTIPSPVSFGATDDPLTSTDRVIGTPNNAGITAAGKFVQVPVSAGAIFLAYNPTGAVTLASGTPAATQVRFSRATYIGILNGTITNWNNPAIAADNAGRGLIFANKPITVVYRSDASGTTFALTNHLDIASAAWTGRSGSKSAKRPVPATPAADTAYWPNTSAFVGVSGGGGVATTVKATSGAIGYLDQATALGNGLKFAILRNKAGNLSPVESATRTVALTSISDALTAALVGATDDDTSLGRVRIRLNTAYDPSAAAAYPIVAPTYLLFYDRYAVANVATGINNFINNFALANSGGIRTTADNIARSRGYGILPDSIKTAGRSAVTTYVDTVADVP